MVNSSALFDINQNHLVGKLILSTVSRGRITGIDMPQTSSVLTITANDLPEKDIKIQNEFFPVFADKYISYLGQPVMAVFAHDRETVDLFCSKVNVNVETEAQTYQEKLNYTPKNFHWSNGDTSKYFVPEAKTVSSSFNIASKSATLMSDERIQAVFSGEVCHIKIASQWPLHVRDSVARILMVSKTAVRVYPKRCRADFDQLVFLPSVYAVIATVAAKKSQSMVELFTSMTSWQPELHFERSTVVSTEGKPLAEKISLEADFGAFPLFIEESCYSYLAGLVPVYDISAIDVNIIVKRSTKHPASFFVDLGYGMALAFTEWHYSKIAQKMGLTPFDWRNDNLNKISLTGERVRKCLSFDALKQTLEDCARDSWFNRKYAVNSQSRFAHQSVSPIAGYANGIGISCGHGISGFSERYTYNSNQDSLSLTVSEDNKVFVALGYYCTLDMYGIYKSIIQNRLGVKKDDIVFLDINSSNVRDIGPNVLSRSITVVPRMIESACTQLLKRMSLGAKPPLVQQAYYENEKTIALYDANTFGTIAVDVHIDPIKVIPVIDKVTARLKFGKVYDTAALSRRIRQTISTTISELCPCAENTFDIDLKVRSNPNLPVASCISMVRGLTVSSLVCAVSQALGHDINKLPISDTDTIGIILKKREKESGGKEEKELNKDENQLRN